jgi:hypothetical protein
MENLTIGFAYYNQPLMLAEWWRWMGVYTTVPKNFRFIFVDDGSPDHPLEVPDLIQTFFNVEVYRIEPNIPWNQPGARNLIMSQAQTDWVLLVDVDHVVSPSLVPQLLAFKPVPGLCYKLGRFYEKTGMPQSMNPNQLLINRDDFWLAGGYDEDFCGHRGHDDHMLKCTLAARGINQVDLPLHRLRSYSSWDIANDESDPPVVSDASVPSCVFDRSPAHNSALLQRKLAEVKEQGIDTFLANRPRPLRFEWHRVL